MAPRELVYVTQVAPYHDGPAGAHGVLDQSATAMAQLAELAGLGFRRVSDVRTLDPTDLDWRRWWLCSPSGRPPGRTHSAPCSSTPCAPAAPRCWPCTRPPMPVTAGTTTDCWSARASPGTRGPSGAPSRSTDPGHPAVAHLGTELVVARRGVHLLRPPARRRRPPPGPARRTGPDGDGRRRRTAVDRLPVVLVLHRRGRAGVLDLARPLPPRLGEPRLPPPPRSGASPG